MVTVWKREGKYGDAGRESTAVVKIKVTGTGVNVEAYTVGPRGGFSPGYPGFSTAEWRDIVAAVERGVCVDHPDAEQYTEQDWVGGVTCSLCTPRLPEVSR